MTGDKDMVNGSTGFDAEPDPPGNFEAGHNRPGSADAEPDRPGNVDVGRVRLAGMALSNGLLIHGPTHWAAAVRTAKGELKVSSGSKPVARWRATRVPGLRGVIRLGEAFAVIPVVRRDLPEARLPIEDLRLAGSMLGASVLSALVRRNMRYSIGRELTIAALGLVPALGALRGSDLASYHGAEHKAIAAYEQGAPDAAAVSKEHERCGSNLVAPMLAASITGNLLLRRLVESPGPAAQGAVAVVSVAGAVELFAWTERHKDTDLARALRKPGEGIQRYFVTREPTAAQLDVSKAALAEILRVEPGVGSPSSGMGS